MLSLLGIVLVTACGNPCHTLASKVCKCEVTERLQQTCIAGLSDDSESGPSLEQQNVCTDLLATTCTGDDLCDRLSRGELSACGLSHVD